MPMPKPKRNVVSTYSESKVKVGVSLTPTGANRLMAIAEKLGLSRSELLERIARSDLLRSENGVELSFTLQNNSAVIKDIAVLEDEQTIAEVHEGDPTTRSPHLSVEGSNELLESYEALQRQSQEQIAAIATLQVQLAQLQNSEKPAKDSVSLESYEALQRQSQEQIATLQTQLTELQTLANQARDSVSLESYEALQKQSQEQIAALQTELTEWQNLITQSEENVSLESYEALQRQSEQQIAAIANLQNQLTELQHLKNQITNSVSLTTYQELQKQLLEQANVIKTLQEQLAQSQTLARIGEAKLNKWRNHTFSL
ncbi:hypothetical protein BCD67_23870 [Oscillatoriales cyanobacterium USR001]|nr:hypothetical protein BCD67_23870 [Oscillatoriales cyanobacterium USR001]